MVLILVIGATLLTAWLVVTLVDKVEQELRKGGHGAEENENLRLAAYQALELTLAVFAEIRQMDEAFYAPSQGWGNPLTYLGKSSARQRNRQATETETSDSETGEAVSDDEAVTHDDGEFFAIGSAELSRLPDNTVAITFPPQIHLSIKVDDLNGKLPVAHVPEERWLIVFKEMGFEDSEAGILTDSLLDWMDEDEHPRLYGAESDFYRQRQPPYRAPNRPIKNFEELRLIQGFEDLFFDEHGVPNEHFRRFLDIVAIRPDGPLNLNSADPLLLQVLEEEIELSAERMQRFLAGASGVRGTLDDGILRPGISTDELPRDREGNHPPLNVQSRWFHIYITAASGTSTFELEALLDGGQAHPGNLYPIRVVWIRENAARL